MILELPPDMEKFEVVGEFKGVENFIEESGLLLPKSSGVYKFQVVKCPHLDLVVGSKNHSYEHITNYFRTLRDVKSMEVVDCSGLLEKTSNYLIFMKEQDHKKPDSKILENLMLGVNIGWDCKF